MSKKLQVRIDPDVAKPLLKEAKANRRSASKEANFVLSDHYTKRKAVPEKP